MLRNLILLLCLVATQASAGAWPRQKGSGFASIATRLEFDETYTLSPSYNSIYLEYGLNGRHTLGVDAGQSSDGATRTVAFLRMPLFETKRGNPVAIELGLGKIDEQIVLRPGMSWGRGLKYGWLAADGLAELYETGNVTLKLDVTFGLKSKAGHMLILQLQNEKPIMAPTQTAFAPSVVLPFGKTRHLEIGGAMSLNDRESYSFKFGLWQDF